MLLLGQTRFFLWLKWDSLLLALIEFLWLILSRQESNEKWFWSCHLVQIQRRKCCPPETPKKVWNSTFKVLVVGGLATCREKWFDSPRKANAAKSLGKLPPWLDWRHTTAHWQWCWSGQSSRKIFMEFVFRERQENIHWIDIGIARKARAYSLNLYQACYNQSDNDVMIKKLMMTLVLTIVLTIVLTKKMKSIKCQVRSRAARPVKVARPARVKPVKVIADQLHRFCFESYTWLSLLITH